MTSTRRVSRIRFLLLVLPLLASCATRVTLPPLPDCHPASAAAPSAERAHPSGLLDEPPPLPAAQPEVVEETAPMEGMDEAEEEMEEMEGHEHHDMHPPPPPPPSPPPPPVGSAAP